MADSDANAHVTIDNRTGLPDEQIEEAVQTYWVENASLTGIANTSFQTYANSAGGSLLARREFRTPGNVFDEIRLARELAERDDDVGATMGAMIALAFGSGMEHLHEDEVTLALFNKLAANGNFDGALKNIYREYLIAGQFTTVSLFTRETYTFTPEGGKRQRTQAVSSPLIGVLPSECIRVIGNDLFGNAVLAYKPADSEADLKKWLDEFFSNSTTAARKAELRRLDPVAATLFMEPIKQQSEESYLTEYVYRLNPQMTHRTTMPKGSWSYPRPLVTRDFALLEAKRLLNIMDFSLLQGGMSYIVVAKKGTDQRPANQPEVQALEETVRRASKTGVIVGDHRLSFEIITPNIEGMLNEKKRNLIGRKLAMALLRIPDLPSESTSEVQADVELLSRVIESDRLDIRRHIENRVYNEVESRNSTTFESGPAKLWFPKIVLQGSQYFTDYVLKLRDRGDIPRKWAVEAGGFDYEAGLEERKREKARGDDRILAPAPVPFSSPNAGPQDNNAGRPVGGSSNNGSGQPPQTSRDGFAPRRQIARNAGETVRAIDHEEYGIMRVGELTWDLLMEYETEMEIGRMTPIEERALEQATAVREGPVAVVPVNVDYEIQQPRVVRLTKGLSVIVGKRADDDALVARALCFREPEFSSAGAEETALRYGFSAGSIEEPELAERPLYLRLAPGPNVD